MRGRGAAEGELLPDRAWGACVAGKPWAEGRRCLTFAPIRASLAHEYSESGCLALRCIAGVGYRCCCHLWPRSPKLLKSGPQPKAAQELPSSRASALQLLCGPGGSILSGDRGGTAVLWDLGAGSASWKLKDAHTGHVTALSWLHDSSGAATHVFLTAGQDGCVKM